MILTLPDELIFEILEFLSNVDDYFAFGQTCSRFFSLIKDETLCERLVEKTIGYETEVIPFYDNLVNLRRWNRNNNQKFYHNGHKVIFVKKWNHFCKNTINDCFHHEIYLMKQWDFDKGILLFCRNGNYKFFTQTKDHLYHVRQMLIECCKYDNPKTFISVFEKMRKDNLNRSTQIKLMKIVCKFDSTRVARLFFDLFDDMIHIFVKNQRIFLLFCSTFPNKLISPNYFMKIVEVSFINDLFQQFQSLIVLTLSLDPDFLKSQIRDILWIFTKYTHSDKMHEMDAKYLLFLFENLPKNFFIGTSILYQLLLNYEFDRLINNFDLISSESFDVDIGTCFDLIRWHSFSSYLFELANVFEFILSKRPNLKLSWTEAKLFLFIKLRTNDEFSWFRLAKIVANHSDTTISDVIINISTKGFNEEKVLLRHKILFKMICNNK